MKQNVKFFTVVIALLLLSAIILTGCMYAIAADNGEMKPYDLNGQKENFENNSQEDQKEPGNNEADDNDSDRYNSEEKCPMENGPDPNIGLGDIIIEDGPTTQASLQAKFEEMYEISEDEKTITVISEAFLDEYWHELTPRSLSTDEVYYIIQDSIRIYAQYDTVILSGFGSFAEDSRHAYIVPYIREDVVIKTQSDVTPYYEWDDTEAICEIILYRLKALSSPKAFFTGEEAMLSVGEEPGLNSTMLPWTTFYIPDYSKSTNRDYILSVVGYGSAMNSTVIEDEFSELFGFCTKYEATITFESKNYEQSTKVYPTVELDNKTKPYFSIKLPELNNAVLEHKQDYKLYLDGELLVGGMAMDFANLCLYDITGDGVPELCFVMATGSGMVDYNIVIMDPLTKECIFSLSDRGEHDYKLFFRDGLLCVLERKYMSIEFTRTGVLTYDGSKISVSWDAEVNYPYDLPTGIPFVPYKDMIEDSNSVPPVNNEKDPTDVHAEDFERYYPDELFNLYDLSKIVSWDEIYAAEERLLKNNANFYNEQLPPLYLMIKELAISKEDFVKVADDISEEQIEWLFATDEAVVMKHLKADWAFYHEGRLYNIFELAELDKDLIIELRECGDLNEFIAYMESLDVELEALEIIKNAGK